ncbi:MAG: peroxide stress protein YaaA [Ottowia sp.]|nr:peroxide stress protein YaaA [Ottowia sp.]
MLIILSPAKSLDYDTPAQTEKYTLPDFIPEAAELVTQLRELPPSDIAHLMHISDHLAALNVARYASWQKDFSSSNAKQALLTFNGDVYEGIDTSSLTAQDLDFAQQSVRILSGLYGVLRPLDWIQPYRLEMSTRLINKRGKNLYAFWGERITHALNVVLAGKGTNILVNLASNEYFKSIKRAALRASVITPVFEDWVDSAQGGHYKINSFYAKRARGMMTRYIINHRLDDVQQLKSFNMGGYTFVDSVSSQDTWVFRRKLHSPK